MSGRKPCSGGVLFSLPAVFAPKCHGTPENVVTPLKMA
jgi:hypothetical protein